MYLWFLYLIGSILSQCDPGNPKLRYVAKFGSITLNEREARFSQPKLELYGLYRALRSLKLYLIGICNMVMEVNAKYIKGMLSNPDIAPLASRERIMDLMAFLDDDRSLVMRRNQTTTLMTG